MSHCLMRFTTEHALLEARFGKCSEHVQNNYLVNNDLAAYASTSIYSAHA